MAFGRVHWAATHRSGGVFAPPHGVPPPGRRGRTL